MSKEQYGNINGSIAAKGGITGGSIRDKGQVSGTVGRAQTVYVRELEFDSRAAFPAHGDSKTLYIATDENAIYRWSSDNSEYIQLSGESQNVRVGTTAYWNSQPTLISAADTVYVYSDYGVKIGDGVSYLSELAFATVFVSEADKTNWNDKVGARVIDLSTLELYK